MCTWPLYGAGALSSLFLMILNSRFWKCERMMKVHVQSLDKSEFPKWRTSLHCCHHCTQSNYGLIVKETTIYPDILLIYMAQTVDYSYFFISFTASVLFQRLTIKFNFFLFCFYFFIFTFQACYLQNPHGFFSEDLIYYLPTLPSNFGKFWPW